MRLPMTAAVITLVGTMMGQLSSSLPSPQSSCASHTHDSKTQRLFCINTHTHTGQKQVGISPAPSGSRRDTLQWKFPGWQKKQFFSSDPLGQRFW